MTVGQSGGSFSTYQAVDAVNWSSLKYTLTSMLHYRHALTAPREDTSAMAFGRLVHCASLEPLEVPRRYMVGELPAGDAEGNRRSAEGKGAHARLFPGREISDVPSDAFKRALLSERHPGREIVSAADYERAITIGDKIRSHRDVARYLLAPGRGEVSIQWRDPETGLPCKARLDWLLADGTDCDLKTAATIAYRPFRSQAWKLGYFHQLAFHRMGLEALTGTIPALRILAVESAPPHDCAVFEPDPEAIDLATDEVKSLLVKLKWARENDTWAGQYDGERILYAPPYVFPEDETDGLITGGA